MEADNYEITSPCCPTPRQDRDTQYVVWRPDSSTTTLKINTAKFIVFCNLQFSLTALLLFWWLLVPKDYIIWKYIGPLSFLNTLSGFSHLSLCYIHPENVFVLRRSPEKTLRQPAQGFQIAGKSTFLYKYYKSMRTIGCSVAPVSRSAHGDCGIQTCISWDEWVYVASYQF